MLADVSAIGPRILARLAKIVPPSGRAPPQKASSAGPLIAFPNLHRPVWTPRDYQAFAREGFMQNAIVYRCVRMIAECTGSVPLLLYDRDVELEDHPLRLLVRRPNPSQTRADLIEAIVGNLLVSGNAYIEAVAAPDAQWAFEGARKGEVKELYVLRPDRMKVVPGSDGWPEAYEYTVAGRVARLSGEVAPGVPKILHLKLFHPDNDHYGLSPLEAAATAIDLHNTASAWNKSLLDNSARPSGALVYTSRDGNLSAEQYERLKSELETSFQGSANAGRPLLLEGGLDWKSMSLSPKDMDYIEARHTAAREIALALGVPPMLLGIPGDNTYSNMAEAQRIFWRTTVLPLVERIAKALSGWLGHMEGIDLQFEADTDALEALSPERDALWARLEKTSFLSENEKRAAIGYGPRPPAAPTSKFNPHYIPAGNGRESGQFTSAPDDEVADGDGTNADTKPTLIADRKTGGIPKALYNRTVRQFASKYCKGYIQGELPGELLDIAIGDMIDIAKGGDAAAKKCYKLLNQPRFRK